MKMMNYLKKLKNNNKKQEKVFQVINTYKRMFRF